MSDITNADQRRHLFILNALELAAAIFRGPDTPGWEAIISVGLPQLLDQAEQADMELTAALQKLQSELPDLKTPGDPLTILETEYVRLFIAGWGGAVAPPYQSCHQGHTPRVMGDTALDMQHRLQALGLEIALESNEPPDHLSIELEYLYHLLATAWTRNNPDFEAQGRDFARSVLAPWLPQFRLAMLDGDAHGAFVAALDVVAAVVDRLA